MNTYTKDNVITILDHTLGLLKKEKLVLDYQIKNEEDEDVRLGVQLNSCPMPDGKTECDFVFWTFDLCHPACS